MNNTSSGMIDIISYSYVDYLKERALNTCKLIGSCIIVLGILGLIGYGSYVQYHYDMQLANSSMSQNTQYPNPSSVYLI